MSSFSFFISSHAHAQVGWHSVSPLKHHSKTEHLYLYSASVTKKPNIISLYNGRSPLFHLCLKKYHTNQKTEHNQSSYPNNTFCSNQKSNRGSQHSHPNKKSFTNQKNYFLKTEQIAEKISDVVIFTTHFSRVQAKKVAKRS